MIVQWGLSNGTVIDSGNNKYRVTLPISYSSAKYIVLAQPKIWAGSAYIVGEVHAETANTIICRTDASSNRHTETPWAYFTIGY